MKKLISFLILFCVSLLSGLSWTAEAANNSAADYLVQVGELSYEKGNIEDAVHEFTKALMLDPNHEKAHQYLDNIGRVQGVSIHQQTSTKRVDELSREVELYQKMLAHVEEQRQDIDMKLKQLTLAHTGVLQDNQSKDEQLKNIQAKIELMGVNLKGLYKEHRSAISARQDGLIEAWPQNIVVKELNYSARGWDRPATESFNPSTMTYAQLNQKTSQFLDVSLNQADELLALSRENRDLQKDLQLQKNGEQNTLEVMEDYLYLHQARMNDVGNQAVISGLDQVEKHKQLLDRAEELNKSYNLLETVANKVNERDGVIQQKNLQINDLQKRLEWYQKSFDVPVNAQL